MLPLLDANATGCLGTLFGCYTPLGGSITISYSTLAILGIVGFVVGFVLSIVVILIRRTYGNMVMVLKPVGLTYKRVYYHKYKDTIREFVWGGFTHAIDTTKASWTDGDNRPVMVYLYDEVMPLTSERTNKRLQSAIRKLKPIQLEMKRSGKDADAFDKLFTQKVFEAFAAAARRVKAKTSTSTIVLTVMIVILVAVVVYFIGSAFPAFQVAHQATTNSTTIAHTTTTSTLTGGGPFG